MNLYPVFKPVRRAQGGQTLLLGVISIVILVVAILLLFDVHTVIRGKIKSQTAVDSAAITGANWQMHSLNLIGELNMVKACTVLISDSIYGVGADPDSLTRMREPNQYANTADLSSDLTRAWNELQKLEEAGRLLTQMQTRIAFVGPLIGYGAAQQAAKNNGITSNEDAGQFDSDMLDDILNDNIYGSESVAQVINDYSWRTPYANMLGQILQRQLDLSPEAENGFVVKGIAVGTKVMRLGTPHLFCDPPSDPDFTSYLVAQRIYSAIEADYWCYIKDLIRMQYNDKWWGEIRLGNNSTFIESSEILPLHIAYFKGSDPYTKSDDLGALDALLKGAGRQELEKIGDHFDRADPYRYQVLTDGDGNKTVSLRLNWRGEPVRNADTDTDLRFNVLPYLTWVTFDEYWNDYYEDVAREWETDYLRSSFQPGMKYNSGALSYFVSRQKTVTLSGSLGDTSTPSNGKSLGNALNFHGSGSMGNQESRFAQRMQSAEYSMNSMPRIETDALAKPLGKITIEGQTYGPHRVRMVLPVFTKSSLIPVALEHVYGMSSIDRDWYLFVSKFLPALGTSNSIQEAAAKLDNKTRNRTAWYAAMLDKLNNPEWRQRGIDWLKAEATGHDVLDYNGKVIRHVTDTTNEDHCDDWGGHGGSGPRQGPGKLH